MVTRMWMVAGAVSAVAACNEPGAVTPSAGGQALAVEQAFGGLSFNQPVALLQAPGDDAHFYVVEQGGRVWVFDSAGAARSLYLDIRERVESGGEKGLLGMAFDPKFATNGRVYLSYTGRGAGDQLTSYVSRFVVPAGASTPDAASEQVVISVAQPYQNHNGGQIAFGPDGLLYIGWGDGGSAGDPQGNGQNTATLLGKILRIEVTDAGYAIPADNPYAQGGGRGEIYAYGLRNPWRWSFDRVDGTLWVGDVGQNKWEEIDIIQKGGNYGWNVREGAHCYNATSCRSEGLIDPVAEYARTEGISVTGGYVYRGTAIPGLQGTYVYGDFGSGRVWGLRRTGEGYASEVLLDTGLAIASFAESNQGELYVLDYGGGKVHHLSTHR